MSTEFVYQTPPSSPRADQISLPLIDRVNRRLVLNGTLPNPLNLFDNNQESLNNELPVLVSRENWVYQTPNPRINNLCPSAPRKRKSS